MPASDKIDEKLGFFMKLLAFLFFTFSLSANFSPQELLEATLYEEAAAIFEKQTDSKKANALALAKCYFALEKFEKVIELLQDGDFGQDERHLLALAYQKLNDQAAAIAILKELPGDEKITFELAQSYFLKKDYTLSENLFAELVKDSKNGKLLEKVHASLIRMDLERGFFEEAEKKLKNLFASGPDKEFFAYLKYLEGDLFFRKREYENAISRFEAILPRRNKSLAPWYKDTLYQLGWSYLKMAEINHSAQYFELAEKAFQELSDYSKEEKIHLSYAEVLLSKGKYLGDEIAYAKANKILGLDGIFISPQGKNRSLFLRAEAAVKYEDREKLYSELIDAMAQKNTELAESWYLRGVNEWNEGRLLESKMQNTLAKKHFKRAVDFLKKSHKLYQGDQFHAALTLKFIAICYLSQKGKENLEEAIRCLTLCIEQSLAEKLEDPLEIYYLRALAEVEIQESVNLLEASDRLRVGIASFRKGAFLDKALFLLGQMLYLGSDFENAEKTFLQIAEEFPNSSLCPKAYYGASLSAKSAKKEEAVVKKYKEILFEKYPKASIAAEAYFNYYAYHEYLQGDRKALKHLQALPIKFPDSVFSLNAYYLLGMDLKRDRKSPQGKWISKKNLTHSVEAFANVESGFDALFNKGLIPFQKLEYYVHLRYRSILERALANYAIAEESKGAKRQIYLEYAGEVFKKIIAEFQENHPFAQKVKEKELFPKIEEESFYYLAKIYWQTDSAELAEKVYLEAIAQYNNSRITKSYFLAKLYIEKGIFAFSQKDFDSALAYYKKAAEAGNGKILNSDETLDLLIQQSICLQETNQLEEAMLLLSQVINCDVASSLRLKAMYLRAGIYEKQGRQQLAKRQLETIVAKGGDWAQQAQEKLEKDYGFY